MTPYPVRADRGAALLLYIWVTGILLFVAFAFFAWAQAASARNGAQSAADAAALAAAQNSRDEVLDSLGRAIGTDDDWLDLLTGDDFTGAGARGAAAALAADNDADVIGFGPAEVHGYPGYRVRIETRYTVGDSIIPGTESQHARAEATAVIEPRCHLDDADADLTKPVTLDCDGGPIEIDPGDTAPGHLPDASDLFSVHLAE